MYAVIRTGGKQYRVEPGQVLDVEKLPGKAGDKVTLEDVLLVQDGKKAPKIGAPLVKDAKVTAEIIEQKRDSKVLVFKKKRRHNYRRTQGHRQYLTSVRIGDISVKAAAKAKEKADA